LLHDEALDDVRGSEYAGAPEVSGMMEPRAAHTRRIGSRIRTSVSAWCILKAPSRGRTVFAPKRTSKCAEAARWKSARKVSSTSVQPVLRGETADSQALKTSASEPVELKLQLLHDDAFSSDGGIATV